MIGRRIRIGDAEIEMTRPARRCAATTVDLDTAATDVNVPVILRKLTGHLYCGIYGRVVKSGAIACSDQIADLGAWEGNPNEDLPVRTPEPAEWPRYLRLQRRADDTIELGNMSENWPLVDGNAGDQVRIHPASGALGKYVTLKLVEDCTGAELVCETSERLGDMAEGAWLLVSGPYPG